MDTMLEPLGDCCCFCKGRSVILHTALHVGRKTRYSGMLPCIPRAAIITLITLLPQYHIGLGTVAHTSPWGITCPQAGQLTASRDCHMEANGVTWSPWTDMTSPLCIHICTSSKRWLKTVMSLRYTCYHSVVLYMCKPRSHCERRT
jgi:hypothetical protein